MNESRSNAKLLVGIFLTYLLYSCISIVSKTTSYYTLSPQFFGLVALLLFLMGAYAIVYQQLIKRAPLSKIYSLRGIIVIYNLLWAAIVFKESITIFNILGSILILCGIYIVGKND